MTPNSLELFFKEAFLVTVFNKTLSAKLTNSNSKIFVNQLTVNVMVM